MKYIIKKKIKLFNEDNIIKFCYQVKLNENLDGFINFDLDNEKILIDNLLEKIDDELINKLSVKLIYIALSLYFFTNIKNLFEIEYETGDSISKITKKDLDEI